MGDWTVKLVGFVQPPHILANDGTAHVGYSAR